VISVILFAEIVIYILNGSSGKSTGIYTGALINKVGNTRIIGEFLFTKYIFPFEVASILLLVAIIGAYLFAKKKY